MSFGVYPEISLCDARRLRTEARALLAKCINPQRHRAQVRQEREMAEDFTFQRLYDLWYAHRALSLNNGRNSTLEQIQRVFKKDVLPRLGKRSVYRINRFDLLAVLEQIEQRRAFTVAEKCRTWFAQLFRFALVKVPRLKQNPSSELEVLAVPKPPVVHHPFLRLPELPALLRSLRGYGGDQTHQALRLLLLTGVRTGELRWATPDQFDLERAVWRIPPERVKQLQVKMLKERKRAQVLPPYIVPLSVQALELVRELLKRVRPAQRFLLSHRSELSKRISENTLNNALRYLGYTNRLTGHGIRATLSTALHEVGYPHLWIEAQMSHIGATYNHAEYVELRRRMMQDRADRLDLLEHGKVDAASTPLSVNLGRSAVLANSLAPSAVAMGALFEILQCHLKTCR